MSTEAPAATALRDDLETALGEFAEAVTVQRERRLFVTLADAEDLVPAMETLVREGITHLSTISGLDDGERYELLYHMLRYGDYEDGDLGPATAVTVRLFLDRDEPEITSLVDTIPGAAMYEREIMDMLDVEFEGHPNPERLMLADDWEAGPPMRKPDPVVEEEAAEAEEEEADESEATDEPEESAADPDATEESSDETEATEATDDTDESDDADDTDEEGDTES
ncbi:MAG TPA: NADH-quinone oxidoreductase subunit C [Natrialbaceae archaeon]|nr:NADH-quinone oxidoreductase subunit C [Natrialbaceae archaeon]